MGFEDQGPRLRVLGLDFRVQGSRFRVWGSSVFGKCVVSIIWGFRFSVEGLKLSVQGLGLGV